MIAWAIFAMACLAIVLFSRRMKKQIEEEGIMTDGVISRITETGDVEDVDLCYYVRYVTDEGKEVEGVLSNPRSDLEAGQRVRIKYHPKYVSNARLVD